MSIAFLGKETPSQGIVALQKRAQESLTEKKVGVTRRYRTLKNKKA